MSSIKNPTNVYPVESHDFYNQTGRFFIYALIIFSFILCCSTFALIIYLTMWKGDEDAYVDVIIEAAKRFKTQRTHDSGI